MRTRRPEKGRVSVRAGRRKGRARVVDGEGRAGRGGAGRRGWGSSVLAGQEGRGMLPRMNGDGVDPVFSVYPSEHFGQDDLT